MVTIDRPSKLLAAQTDIVGQSSKLRTVQTEISGQSSKLRTCQTAPQDEFQSRNWSDSVALAEFTNDGQTLNTPQRRSHRAGHPCRLGLTTAFTCRAGCKERDVTRN